MRPALVSGPPNRKKPYNKHLISLVFSVCTVNYESSFFSNDSTVRTENSANKRYIFFEVQNFSKEGKCVYSPRVSQLPEMKKIAKIESELENNLTGSKNTLVKIPVSIYHLKSITAVLIQIHGRIMITQYCTTCNYYPELGLPVVQCKFSLKKKHLV